MIDLLILFVMVLGLLGVVIFFRSACEATRRYDVAREEYDEFAAEVRERMGRSRKS